MKIFSLIVSLILIFSSVSPASASISNFVSASSNGGKSSVNVRINNNVNTGSSSFSSSQSQTSSNVEIHQDGTGTSEVTINGKTWKQEGPGDISVHESSAPTAGLSPTAGPASPSVTPSVTTAPSPTQAVLSAINSNTSLVREFMNQIFSSFQHFFSEIFR